MCPRPRSEGGGCLPDPAPLAEWSRERWKAQCMWCCWSRSREWLCWSWSGPEVSDGSYCSVRRCARCQEECLRGPTGSCGLGRRRCWVQCSRHSDEGRTRKTQVHRERAGTQARSLQWAHTHTQTGWERLEKYIIHTHTDTHRDRKEEGKWIKCIIQFNFKLDSMLSSKPEEEQHSSSGICWNSGKNTTNVNNLNSLRLSS